MPWRCIPARRYRRNYPRSYNSCARWFGYTYRRARRTLWIWRPAPKGCADAPRPPSYGFPPRPARDNNRKDVYKRQGGDLLHHHGGRFFRFDQVIIESVAIQGIEGIARPGVVEYHHAADPLVRFLIIRRPTAGKKGDKFEIIVFDDLRAPFPIFLFRFHDGGDILYTHVVF